MDEVLCEEDFVRGMARNLSAGNTHDADDLTQELWLAVLESPPKNRGAIRGWIVRVLNNRTASSLRHKGVRRLEDSVDLELIADRAEDSDRLLVEEIHGRVEAAVGRLPGVYSEVLQLRFFEGHGPAAISERMGATLETTRTRLRRGRRLLYADLERNDMAPSGVWPSLGGLLALCIPRWRTPKAETVRWAGLMAGVVALVAVPLAMSGIFDDGSEASRAELFNVTEVEAESAMIEVFASNVRSTTSSQPMRSTLELALMGAGTGAPFVGNGAVLVSALGAQERALELDEQGHTAVEDLEPGIWNVRVGQWQSTPFSLDPGVNKESIHHPPLRPLSVFVKDVQGNPLDGAMVDLWSLGVERPDFLGRTDALGQLETHVSLSKAYLLARNEAGFWSGVAALNDIDEHLSYTLLAKIETHHKLRFVDGSGIALRAVEAIRGDESFAQRVSHLAYGINSQTKAMALWRGRVDDDGLMRLPSRLHGGVTPGLESVMFQTVGGEVSLQQLPHHPSEETLTIQMGATISVRGIVTGKDGIPVAGVRVICAIPDIPAVDERVVTSDRDGRFVIAHLARGIYSLKAEHAGWRGKVVVDLAVSDPRELELVLHKENRPWLRVRVVDPFGQPIQNALVRTGNLSVARNPNNASDVSLCAVYSGLTDEDGWVQADSIASDKTMQSMIVWASESAGRAAECGASTVYVPGDEVDPQVTLVLDRTQSCSLTGRIGKGSEPSSGVLVAWSRAKGYSRQVGWEPDSGRFTFAGLEPGVWSLVSGRTVLGTYTLGPSIRLDVGVVENPELGRVVVRFDPNMPGIHDAPVRLLALFSKSLAIFGRISARTMPAELASKASAEIRLPAGDYSLSIQGGGVAGNRYQSLTIESGETIELSLDDFEVGRPLRCFVYRLHPDVPEKLRIEVSEEGRVLKSIDYTSQGLAPFGFEVAKHTDKSLLIQVLDQEGNLLAETTVGTDWIPFPKKSKPIKLYIR